MSFRQQFSCRKSATPWRTPPIFAIPLSFAILILGSQQAFGQHRLLIQGNGRLAILDQEKRVEWEMPWEGVHDMHVLANGHILVQQGKSRLAEIDPVSKSVVWTYDSATSNGNQSREIEVHAFQPLAGDHFMIAESGAGRIIEIDRQGKLLHEIKLKVDHPHPHTDTRLARKLDNGHYLVCHEGDGFVREYDSTGAVVWEYEIPLFGKESADGHGPESYGNKVFSAVRLPAGNTLIGTGNGHRVLEVTPEKTIVWSLQQDELPGIVLAWVTTLEVLPNGHYILGNCHAGPESPSLIEIDPKTKSVVWSLKIYDTFGNDVSNSHILDPEIQTLR